MCVCVNVCVCLCGNVCVCKCVCVCVGMCVCGECLCVCVGMCVQCASSCTVMQCTGCLIILETTLFGKLMHNKHYTGHVCKNLQFKQNIVKCHAVNKVSQHPL